MGTTASKLAHEFNQPITAVVIYVTGVRNMLAEGDPANAAMIGEAVNEAMRVGNIVRRLRRRPGPCFDLPDQGLGQFWRHADARRPRNCPHTSLCARAVS